MKRWIVDVRDTWMKSIKNPAENSKVFDTSSQYYIGVSVMSNIMKEDDGGIIKSEPYINIAKVLLEKGHQQALDMIYPREGAEINDINKAFSIAIAIVLTPLKISNEERFLKAGELLAQYFNIKTKEETEEQSRIITDLRKSRKYYPEWLK